MARKRDEAEPITREDCHSIVPCAFDGCPDSAILRRKTPTGYANLCDRHDVVLVTNTAKVKFREIGLERWHDESYPDWTARVREYTKLIVKRAPVEPHPVADEEVV